MSLKSLTIACVITLALAAQDVWAVDKKDLKTIGKAVSFMNGGPNGDVTVDILYDTATPESSADADKVANLLGSGFKSGRVTFKANKISSPQDISSRVVFITKGASVHYAAALDKVSTNNGITVSNDEQCLEAGCVLVVKTKPSIDILVSTAAADKAGVQFASAFSMMITKK